MSEAYERERQNNARLEELSSKVTALRGVTVDIYDNARAQDVIDNTVRSKLASSSPPSKKSQLNKTDMTSPISSPTHSHPWPPRSKALPPD